MSSDPSVPLPSAPPSAERERVVQALCAHFANDHLSVEELESRLDQAYRVGSLTELGGLLADLPALTPTGTVSSPIASSAPVPPRGVVIAVMSGSRRRGSWPVPRLLKVFAFMGGVSLDLRQAILAPGITEIEAYAFMGGVEILVPPDVAVENVGSAFMGGFDVREDERASTSLPPRAVLRVSGFAFMGGVDTRVERDALPGGRGGSLPRP